MNTNEKGGLGETRFIYELTRRGWKVSISLGHGAAYDMIADDNGTPHRIQVKSTSSTDEVLNVRTERTYTSGDRVVSRLYAEDDFDFLGIFDMRQDKCYLVPISLIANKRSLSLRFSPAKNNQKTGIHLASDFVVK